MAPGSLHEAFTGERLLTVADVAVMPEALPSGPVRWELCRGELAVHGPLTDGEGVALAQICHQLVAQGNLPGHGAARARTGVILGRSPDTVVAPAALFVTQNQLPLRMSPEEYLETIPAPVVEIFGAGPSTCALREKVERYLAAGVQVVWVLEPAVQTVTEYRPGVAARTLTAAEELTCPDLIPGFKVQVVELF